MWNWQQQDWPRFQWDNARLRRAEARFLQESGRLGGLYSHLAVEDREQISVEAMSTEAVTTSEIEGEVLNRASVQSSIRKELGLGGANRRATPAESGISKMMVDLHRTAPEPLSKHILYAWHAMAMNGRNDLKDIGRYRRGGDPMHIVSGRFHDQRVHFEAPPASQVPAEMKTFVEWFNRTGPDGEEPLPGITRAGIAHLYFESIHPFEDGNGRIGRAISEKALAQNAETPAVVALAATILIRRKAYYSELEKANCSNEISRWLAWFAGTVLEAQKRTQARVEFVIDKTRLLDRVRGDLNDRQEKALLRMFRQGPEGFEGGMSAGNYSTITNAAPATATRDLGALVEMGALVRTGERRHVRYFLAIPLRPVSLVRIDERGAIR